MSGNVSNLTFTKEVRDTFYMTGGYIAMCVLGLLIGLLNIFLNVFVLIVFRSSEFTCDSTVTFLRHNAIADAIIGLITIYHNIYLLFLYVDFRECLFRNSLICGTTLLSLLVIMGLNIERYLKIWKPFHYQIVCNTAVIRGYLITVWTVAIIFAFVPHLTWIDRPTYVGYCRFFGVLTMPYLMGVCILTFCVILIQSFIYLHIFLIALTKRMKDRRSVGPFVPKMNNILWWKPAKIVLIIVGFNVSTFAPVGIYILLVVRGHLDYQSDDEKEMYTAFASLSCFLNSALNPILYSFHVSKVKKTFIKTFCCSRALTPTPTHVFTVNEN